MRIYRAAYFTQSGGWRPFRLHISASSTANIRPSGYKWLESALGPCALGKKCLIQPFTECLAIMGLYIPVGNRIGPFHQAGTYGGPCLWRIIAAFRIGCGPEQIDKRNGLCRKGIKCRRAAAAHNVIRVLPGGKRDKGQAVAGAEQRERPVRRPQRRPLPRCIAIKGEYGHGHLPPRQVDLMLGQRRAQRGDGFGNARLCQRNHVHIAFDDE